MLLKKSDLWSKIKILAYKSHFTAAKIRLHTANNLKLWLVSARIESAKNALELVPDCPSALILLGEEDATTVTEAEQYFQKAQVGAETRYKRRRRFFRLTYFLYSILARGEIYFI